jgi:hypothetical protein
MDQAEFDQIKTTFPWSERILQTNVGGLVQILDNRGHEVSIFTMSRFLQMITECGLITTDLDYPLTAALYKE